MEKIQTNRRWRWVLTLVTLLALTVLIYAVRHQLKDTLTNLGKVNAWALLLMIPLQAVNYHAQAKLYQSLFKILGSKISYKFAYRTALELNFVNNVFPSGGVSGISFFGVRMKSKRVSAGRATLVQILKLFLVFTAFQILLGVGLITLAIGGKASNLAILVAATLATLVLVGTLLLVYIVGSKQRINAFLTFITKALNQLIHIVRPRHPETINIVGARRMFTDLHENYLLVKNNFSALRKPLFYALLANTTEILTIYVVYLAFGHLVNIGAVIIAYAVANFAGIVSVLPGGVGIYEALMTGVLAAAGVTPAISIPVTVMYRVLNMLLQLPLGYFYYHKSLQKGFSK